jgi:hypothetical protein
MRSTFRAMRIAGVGALALGFASTSQAIVNDVDGLAAVAGAEVGHAEHCDADVAVGDFEAIFICGDELFEVDFNAAEGGGANVGDGQRYTRVPRADKTGPGEWANHTPARATGPNSSSCGDCHSFPVGTAAGRTGFNAIRDPGQTGDIGRMIQRNTPMLMGSGALQLLAEEINVELEDQVLAAMDSACATRDRTTVGLSSKGVDFGTAEVNPKPRGACRPHVRISAEGVDNNLVVKPYQWKGNEVNMRGFVRGAFHNELGIQPVELAGDGVDGDGDGVVDEVSVADVTATTVYTVGQPRPVTEIELNDLRAMLIAEDAVAGALLADELGLPALTGADIAQINAGEQVFTDIGCGDCHMPQMLLENPVFSEPSQNANYRDVVFPAGQDPVTRGLDPANAVTFDITADMLDNHVGLGGFFQNVANFTKNGAGQTEVDLYGDLKRHDMGRGLAENIDEAGTGASNFLTKELWGVGSTLPYLHDGRATTVTEAILEHGGEAQGQRDLFAGLTTADQADLSRFLNNLVIFKVAEE